MKATTIISKMLELDIRNDEATTITTQSKPIEDFCRAIGDFRITTKLQPHTTYLLIWENFSDNPRLGEPDGLIIPDVAPITMYICLYVID